MVQTTVKRLQNIAPHQIHKNPDNPRLIFRQDEMESLLISIDRHGIQVPIAVYREADEYILIDGERRWRCALKLNLRTIPALVQEKPTPLENLLLMYNIHALREQWDYFTIASKLTTVIDLFVKDRGHEPNEIELSESTGLTRGQIRRCRLLLDLPQRFKEQLLQELDLPKSRQKLSEDLFIEMEKSLKTVTRRLPTYQRNIDDIRDTLIDKFRHGTISAVTDFRQLSKIATAVDNLGVARQRARRSLDRVFDADDAFGIREAYESTVEFRYDEQKARRQVISLDEFIHDSLSDDEATKIDPEFLEALRSLYQRLSRLFRHDQ